jgi:hypothetical protein
VDWLHQWLSWKKEGIPMRIKMISLIKNMTRVLGLLLSISVELVTNVVKNITKALLIPLGIGVQLVNIVICVCILLVGILPVLKFLATIDHTGL